MDGLFERIASTKQALVDARKEELRGVVSLAASRADWLEREARAGKMSWAVARDQFLRELRVIRFGHGDYLFASDYRAITLSHPDAGQLGADMSQVKDVQGHYIVPPMIEGAISQGRGFYSYYWNRLNERTPTEKLTYYQDLPYFKMIVAAGFSIDDIDA